MLNSPDFFVTAPDQHQ